MMPWLHRLRLLLIVFVASFETTRDVWGAANARTDDPGGSPLNQVSPPDDHRAETITASSTSRSGRGLFVPRVEYDEWTPLGHGDPLKNDPTYDYVPPVLERVRYWIEPPSRPAERPQQQTSPAITSSATQSYHHPSYNNPSHLHTYPQRFTSSHNPPADSRRDAYPFLTLVDGPKFNVPPSSTQHKLHNKYQQNYQVLSRPNQQYSRPNVGNYRPAPTRAPVTVVIPPSTTSWLFDLTVTTSDSSRESTGHATVLLTPSATTPTTFASPMPTNAPSTSRSTPATTQFTSSVALTTDPLFAHYKQPSEPLQGPMYLIIEGHSKVKTYGAGKTIHGIPVDASSPSNNKTHQNQHHYNKVNERNRLVTSAVRRQKRRRRRRRLKKREIVL